MTIDTSYIFAPVNCLIASMAGVANYTITHKIVFQIATGAIVLTRRANTEVERFTVITIVCLWTAAFKIYWIQFGTITIVQTWKIITRVYLFRTCTPSIRKGTVT